MVSFNCDGCGDVVKKPKLQQHYQRCYAPVTCLDCSMQFNSPNEFKSHNSCISEAEKYQKTVYKSPKKNGNQANDQAKKAEEEAARKAEEAKRAEEEAKKAEEKSAKRKRKEEEQKTKDEEKAAKKAKKEKKYKKDHKEEDAEVDSRFVLSKLQDDEAKEVVEGEEEEEEEEGEHEQDDPLADKVIKPLSAEELEAFQKKQRKLGIIYISRIPPGMTPAKVRHILSNIGEVGRIYLQDGSKKDKSKKRSSARYTEGWVEFKSKKVAKAAAEMLNAQPIGALSASSSKKSGSGMNSSKRFRDDVWTMKYLKGFKWHMLSEQMAQEQASHAARLRNELSQSAYEQKDYLKKVERAKVQKFKEEKKKKSGKKSEEATEGSAHYRTFKQKAPVVKDVRDQRAEA